LEASKYYIFITMHDIGKSDLLELPDTEAVESYLKSVASEVSTRVFYGYEIEQEVKLVPSRRPESEAL